MSTHHQSPQPSQTPGSLMPLMTTLAAAAALFAIVLLVIGETGLAIAPVVLFLILAGAGMFDSLVARRKLKRHGGDVQAVDADESDSFPTMAADDEVPLGATRESHSDLDPHDLPPGHPSREAVEEATDREREQGTVRRP